MLTNKSGVVWLSGEKEKDTVESTEGGEEVVVTAEDIRDALEEVAEDLEEITRVLSMLREPLTAILSSKPSQPEPSAT